MFEALRRSRLAVRIALAFGVLALVLTALASIHVYYAWVTVKREKVELLGNLTELSAAAAQVFLNHYEKSLPALARDINERVHLTNVVALGERLRQYREADAAIGALYLFSPDGVLLASSNRGDVLPNSNHIKDPVFRRDFERALKSDRMVVGRTRFGTMVKDWIIPLRIRASANDGAPLFVLSAVITLHNQQAMWRGVSLPAAWGMGLLREDGYLQSCLPAPADPTSAFTKPHPGTLSSALSSADALTGVVRLAEGKNRVDSITAYRRLANHAMAAFVEMPLADLHAAWYARIRVPLALFAISLAALGFAAFWLVSQQRRWERERNSAEQTLRASAAELRRQTLLLEQSQRAANIGGWELDAQTQALYWTDETYRIHETTRTAFIPALEKALAFYTPICARQLAKAIERAIHTGEGWDLELEMVTLRGRNIWVRSTGKTEVVDGKVAKVWGSYQDITDRRQTEERIRHLAHFDSLTGLGNRNLFTTYLAHAIDRAARGGGHIAVLFIDLDRFKNINDAVGHEAGDQVLRLMAQRFSGMLRAADLLARLGGDEFIIAMEDAEDSEAVATLARRLLTAVEQPLAFADDEFVMTASIGIAMYPNDGDDVQTLIKHADTAMYRAKEQGKNRFQFYSAQMSLVNLQRLALENQLKKAIQDGNQLLLEYQPRLELTGNTLCAAEALLRWVHPERGIVLPSDFITLAEETGLIHQVGAWVLRNACAQAAGWPREGRGALRVAVNLSTRELYGANLVRDVRETLRATGLPPDCLEVEITETVMMHNLQQVADVLSELKDLGVRIAVDDFGTGYSSLTYMKRLPIDCVKIDRSFVRDVPSDPDDVAITRAVIAMAHSLRVKVVAEGVETELQLRFLRDLGCDEVQGFLISPPLAHEDLLRVLASGVEFSHGRRERPFVLAGS